MTSTKNSWGLFIARAKLCLLVVRSVGTALSPLGGGTIELLPAALAGIPGGFGSVPTSGGPLRRCSDPLLPPTDNVVG